MVVEEVRLRHLLEKLSNNDFEDVEIDDQWIEDAGEQFKDAVRRQLSPRPDKGFRLRMSNLGRPLCQLQMEKAGAEKSRLPYNHIVRMLHGDIIECLMEIFIRAAGLNVTGGKAKVSLDIAGETIKGENDIEVDGKIWDTKSCSPWAYTNKWSLGMDGLRQSDDFGYVSQLVGYAEAENKPVGGWFVVNKSSGEVSAVPADMTPSQLAEERKKIEANVKAITSDAPFRRCFEPETEFFRKKPTGSKRLPATCTFCPFMQSCWPHAEKRPSTVSKAKDPPMYWYTEYNEDAHKAAVS